MLAELGVVERRYRAVLQGPRGRDGHGPREALWVARQTGCMTGWAAMPVRVGWGRWRTGRRGRGRVRVRFRGRWRRGSSGLRRAQPGWGRARFLWHLEREGVAPLPGRFWHALDHRQTWRDIAPAAGMPWRTLYRRYRQAPATMPRRKARIDMGQMAGLMETDVPTGRTSKHVPDG